MSEILEIPDIDDKYKRIKIDIGLSNEAVYSSVWINSEPDLFVLGFEPLPTAIPNILHESSAPYGDGINPPNSARHLKKWMHKQLHIYQVALSDVKEEETKTFHVSKFNTGCSSFWSPKKGNMIDKGTWPISVKVWNLKMVFDKFFEKYNKRFEYIEYIKIDAQGSDLNIVKSAGHWLSDKVVYMTVECDGSYYENCSWRKPDLDIYMESIGFDEIDHYNTHDPTYINSKFKHLKDSIYISQNSGVK